MTDRGQPREQPLHPAALASIVIGWLALTAFGAFMTYAAWTQWDFPRLYALGPTLGLIFLAAVGLVGLPVVIASQIRLRRSAASERRGGQRSP
jgi:hypothetical protein